MVQSVARTLDLLEVMKQPQKSFSLAQLSEAVNLPPSTTHRILQTLCEKNYAVRDEHTHMYSLGPALISLGGAAAHNLDLRQVATPVLKRLSAQTQEDSFLIILSGYRGTVLCQEDGPRSLKIVEKPGYEVALHCGAIRKALLAHQDSYFIQNYFHYCREMPGIRSIPDPGQLLAELRTIRENGVAFTNSDYVQDAVGIGAPVFDAQGRVQASLGIVLPSVRAQEEVVQAQLKQMVKQSAAALSTCLGYMPLGL